MIVSESKYHITAFCSICLILCAGFSPSVAISQAVYGVSGGAYDAYTGEDIDSFSVTMQVVNEPTLVVEGFFPDNYWWLSITTDGIDNDDPRNPEHFLLKQNYPNPFNPVTIIPFNISETGHYTLQSFNPLGERTCSSRMFLGPGNYEVAYGFGTTSGGLQIVRLSGKGSSQTIKILAIDGGDGTGFTHPAYSTGQDRMEKQLITTQSVREDNLEVVISTEKVGYYTNVDTLFLQPDFSNAHNILLTALNYPPVVVLETIVELVPEAIQDLPKVIAAYTYVDPDTDDVIVTSISSSSESAFFSIDNSNVYLDSLTQGFNGVVNYIVMAQDDQGAEGWDSGQIYVIPTPDSSLVHFNFKSVYGDTTLTSGTSTLTYRKMLADSSGYLWGQDSVAVSNNGEFEVLVEQGALYDFNGFHTSTDAYDYQVIMQRNGVTVEEKTWDDDFAGLVFTADADTVDVYKFMNDFPMIYMSFYASKDAGVNVGIRKFADSEFPVSAYWVVGDGHEAPDSIRMARFDSLVADVRNCPHQQNFYMNQEFVDSSPDDTPYFRQGIHPDYPSPGTSVTSYNSETNEIIVCGARFPWQPDEYTQKIEELQAWWDLQDWGGDPIILENVGGVIKLNDRGRRVISALGIARPGTKF